jgi:hypothetical protein
MLDMHEAVKLSKSSGVSGLEALESSGHWAALEELGQRIMMKVAQSWTNELTARNLPS